MKDYDKAVAETEKIGAKLDEYFFGSLQGYEEWRGDLVWTSSSGGPYQESYDYKIRTTDLDGSPRTLVTNRNGERVDEYDENGKYLGGITVYITEHLGDSLSTTRAPVLVGYDEPGGPLGVWPPVNTVPGTIDSYYGWDERGNSGIRVHGLNPKKENLPNPISKVKEFTAMLKKGQLVGKVVNSPQFNEVDSNWRPIEGHNPRSPSNI